MDWWWVSQLDPQNPIAVEILCRMREAGKKGREIRLYWVKAHVGIPGNEREDELAKRWAIKDKRAPVYDRFPISFGKTVLRERTEALWQARYLQAEGGPVARIFFRDVKLAHKILRKLHMVNIYSLIFTGHGGTRPWCTSCWNALSLRGNATSLGVALGTSLTDLAGVVGTAHQGELEAFCKYAHEIVGRAARANGSTVG